MSPDNIHQPTHGCASLHDDRPGSKSCPPVLREFLIPTLCRGRGGARERASLALSRPACCLSAACYTPYMELYLSPLGARPARSHGCNRP